MQDKAEIQTRDGPTEADYASRLSAGEEIEQSRSLGGEASDGVPGASSPDKQAELQRQRLPAGPGREAPGRQRQQRPRPRLKQKPKQRHRFELLSRSSKQALVLILFLVGLIVCVTSLVCLLLLPGFVSNQIAKKLVLKNNSLLLERWSKPNVPMHFKVWLFNVKNAQELIDKRDTQPRLEEIGPFVFNLRRQKDVVSFAGDNLYYTERRVYHFNRELSCCAINTTVTIPNIPLVAVVDRALAYNLPIVGRFVPRLINRAIQSLREQLFVRKQVREILFEGYDVELLRMVSRVGSLVGLPQQSQKFALLKDRNDTWRPEQDGVWAINTGQRERKKFGRVSSWNSYKKLPFWSGAQCNVINGSDGTLFPPPIKRTEPLYIFNQELCRSVNLIYDGPGDVRSIQAYRFVLNPLNFAHTMGPTQPAGLSVGAGASAGPFGRARQATPARINPVFTNSRRGHTAASLPPMSGARLTNGPAASGAFVEPANRPAARASMVSPMRPTPADAAHRDLKPSGSVPTPARANLMPGGEQLEPSGAELRGHQERLVRVAQDAQMANERRPMNPQTCFCDRKQTQLNGVSVCEFDGLIDLSKCSKQAQVIFGSMPHFHNSDPRLLRQVSGLEPNASRHTTYLYIEPNTGLVLGGKRRVQLNVLIKHNNEIDGFENIQDMLVPIVWFEESAMIPEESAQKFRSLYLDRVRFVNWTLVSLFLGSILLLLVDARLLIATHYWRQFKLMSSAQAGRLNGGGVSAAGHDARAQRQEQAAGLEGAGKVLPRPLGKLVTLATAQSEERGGRQSEPSLGAPSANLPLLQHSGSSSSSSPGTSCTSTGFEAAGSRLASGLSAPSSSGGETPPDSPELRNWSGERAELDQSPTNTTRIYLSATRRANSVATAAAAAAAASTPAEPNGATVGAL